MSPDEKLAAILAAVQADPGNRGLARNPHDNLFTACPGDFAAACRSIAGHPDPSVAIVTGFFIPTAEPPANETDGPLGAVFLYRALKPFGIFTGFVAEQNCSPAFDAGLNLLGDRDERFSSPKTVCRSGRLSGRYNGRQVRFSHLIAVERVGPAGNGRCHTMRGIDITDRMEPAHELFDPSFEPDTPHITIGIGDGGNEIGMGKIPHETIVKNIPNGDLIHCRVPTDHLIVAGVSNWGAYALAAGVYVLRGAMPPADLFDPVRECEILGAMVREGPLVDGVTGQQTATVDGLTWDDYARPLVRIREILEA